MSDQLDRIYNIWFLDDQISYSRLLKHRFQRHLPQVHLIHFKTLKEAILDSRRPDFVFVDTGIVDKISNLERLWVKHHTTTYFIHSAIGSYAQVLHHKLQKLCGDVHVEIVPLDVTEMFNTVNKHLGIDT